MSKVAAKLKNKKIILLCLVVIIAIQCAISMYSGAHKNGFQLDEMYTYELANHTGGRIGWIDSYIDSWQSASDFHDVMSVSEEERFNFLIPYENQVNDVHPFLYYFAVHLVCSFFPEANWKWIGIIINLCFSVVTSIFLFKLSKTITKSNTMSLVCVIAWGWSIGAVGTTIFLRMYAMLGMWCVILAFLLTKLVQNVSYGQLVKKRCWIELLLITVAGFLTQYYFLVFCFIACLLALIYFLVKKEWKKSLIFVISEFGGIVLSYICFPAMISHIFNGYRGAEAFDNFSSSENAMKNFRAIVTLISDELFNGWVKEIVAICIIIIVLYWLFCIFHPRLSVKDGAIKLTAKPGLPKQFSIALQIDRGGIIFALGAICLGYIVIISRIAPYRSVRYYFCIFPILMIIAVFLLFALGNYIIKRKKIVCILSLAIVVFITGVSHIKQEVPYQYTNYSERTEALSKYLEYPAIVINFGLSKGVPDRWLYEYERFPAVYLCSRNSYEGIMNAVKTKNLSNGFLVYAEGVNMSDEEFIENLSDYIAISDWEIVTDIGTKVYFCETSN